MPEAVSPFLAPWDNFYIMTGSAAAALVGLMFVVITLVTAEGRAVRSSDGIATFSTPTVLHFAAALLVSAIMSAPWRSLFAAGTLIGVAGLGGIVYLVRVMYLARRLETYRPDLEDWIWFTVLPFIAYGALCAGGIALRAVPAEALFAVAGGVVLLIFIGIRNAWDVVTYIAIGPAEKPPAP
jgi:hypothetical protein